MFYVSNSSSCSGIVIRNSLGQSVRACCKKVYHVSSSFTVEALAAVHRMEFAVDLGFTNVIIEGDSLSIIKKLNNREANLSEISALIWKGQMKAKRLHECSFSLFHDRGIKSPIPSPSWPFPLPMTAIGLRTFLLVLLC
ncbi:hypothetical protein V6N13_076276 [Hibiscus sabdariffa]|uniref:RNase H type-1 domain-containing protein n=1 Tax=Hibiscus sabdariffa TaxID=183260 RepID=A0ABR2CVY3_9ROSI